MIETYRRYYYNLCILKKCIVIKYEHVSTYSKPKINIISLKKLIATRCKLLTGLQVKNKNKVAFLVEVEQAGIFTIQGTNPEQLEHVLGSFCPSLLFPYAREIISSEVLRGSFPPLVLSPVNFDAIFWQQKQQEQEAH